MELKNFDNRNRPDISIVVPVYNVESYIKRCLDSLLAQTLRNIEIIVIDDGSTDESGKIADQYALSNSRIKVIHQANRGLGFARNAGINVASGRYIGFVDSDDWVDKDMFSRLVSLGDKCESEIVFSGYRVISNEIVRRVVSNPYAGKVLASPSEIASYRRYLYGGAPDDRHCDSVPVSVWCAIYSTDFIRHNSLQFDRAKNYEDGFFNIKASRLAHTIAISDIVAYCYRKDGQLSITNHFDKLTVDSCIKTAIDLYDLASDEGNPNLVKECELHTTRHVMASVRGCIFKIIASDLPFGEKRALVATLLNNKKISFHFRDYPIRKLPIWEGVVLEAMILRSYLFLFILAKTRRAFKS